MTNANGDGLAGNPSFYQDPEAPWVQQLEEWSGLKSEVASSSHLDRFIDHQLSFCCISMSQPTASNVEQVVTFGTNATAYSAPQGQGMPKSEQMQQQVEQV